MIGWRRCRTLSLATAGIGVMVIASDALASELIISRQALQALVVAAVFKDQGRWYLAKGKCYAYLEKPHVGLAAGRVVIDAHLSSQLGVVLGDSCLGAPLASDVRLSGKLAASGSRMRIDDVHIDSVQDESARQVVELLQAAGGRSVPSSVNVDLLPLLKPTNWPGTDLRVSATSLEIAAVTTNSDSVEVEFEIKLAAR